jgi:hypothetical protein
MHTMIVTMTLDPTRREDVERHLREEVVAWAMSRPGFVTGRWLCSENNATGMGVVTFTTADAASAAAIGPRTAPPGKAWTIESVEIFEQVVDA